MPDLIRRWQRPLKRFQKRHNLKPDGVVGNQTLAVMNIPVAVRIKQIIINMERYRWLKRRMGDRLVAVNIAGFEVFAGKPGTIRFEDACDRRQKIPQNPGF